MKFTVKIQDPDGHVVFAGYLEPDQFKIIHYPDRASRLEITLDDRGYEDALLRLHDKRITRLTEENA